ncbi:MAG TPA: S8 family serine peptidase, partial [Kofleriaceae bacterium]
TYPSAKTAIDNLAAAGIATVVAAGNDGYTNAVAFPGCLSSAVTVGATTKTDGIPSYTNLSTGVDVLAPGSSITAAVSSSTTAVGTKSGTSMASPHVAGALAVMRQAVPSMTVAQAVAALQATGKAITDTRSGGTITKSRIDVAAAIAAMLQPTPAGCTRQAPTVSVTQPSAVASPDAARFVVTLKNNDPSTCGASSFDLETAPPTGWIATSATPSVAAGQTVTTTIDVTPPSTLLSGDTTFTFTATNIGARAMAGSATGTYTMSCAHATPVVTLAPDDKGVLTASISNLDPATCSATMFHVTVQASATVTPSSNDIEVAAGAQSDVALPFDPSTKPGDYPVAITLTTDDGAVVAQANGMATVTEQEDIAGPDLGCSASGTGGAGTAVLVGLGLGLVTLRRRRRS